MTAAERRETVGRRARLRGLTLTELMIVVVVVGILAAVAYPSYRDFAVRAKRNEARAALLQVATNQERYYLNNHTYSPELTDLGFSSSPFTTETGSYVVRIVSADSSGYAAEADYQFTDNEESECNLFTIDDTGTKRSSPSTDCWTRTR